MHDAEALDTARQLLSRSRPRDAITILDRLIAVGPNAAALALRGDCHRAIKAIPGAVADYRAALALDANLADAHGGLGAVLGEQQKFDEALTHLERARELDPHRAQALHDHGTVLGRLGRHAEAVELFTQSILREPDVATTWFNRGSSHLALGNGKEGLHDLEEAIRLEPRTGRFYAFRSKAHQMLGDLDRALADAEQSLRLDPDDDTSLLRHAELLIRLSRPRDALAPLNRLIGHGKLVAVARAARGHAHMMISAYPGALADFEAALKYDPSNPMLHVVRGGALQKLNQHARAIEAYSEAMRLSEEDVAEVAGNRAVCLRELGKLSEALADFDLAVSRKPDSPALHHLRGRTRYMAKDYAGAIADYEKALTLMPEDSQTLNQVAWVLATCPDPGVRNGARAVELARKACEMKPTPPNLDTLAAALAELGQWDEAVKVIRQALAKGPKPEHVTEFRNRLAQYQQRRPFRT